MDTYDGYSQWTTYEKSEQADKFDDKGLITVAGTCPIARDGSTNKDNQFRVRAVYEIPVTTPGAGTVSVQSSVKAGEDSPLEYDSGDLSLQANVYTGPVLSASSEKIPFFTDYPFVTHKDRPVADGVPVPLKKGEAFFIKYILKPQRGSAGKYMVTFSPGENFKVRILKIKALFA